MTNEFSKACCFRPNRQSHEQSNHQGYNHLQPISECALAQAVVLYALPSCRGYPWFYLALSTNPLGGVLCFRDRANRFALDLLTFSQRNRNDNHARNKNPSRVQAYCSCIPGIGLTESVGFLKCATARAMLCIFAVLPCANWLLESISCALIGAIVWRISAIFTRFSWTHRCWASRWNNHCPSCSNAGQCEWDYLIAFPVQHPRGLYSRPCCQ